MIKIVSFVGVLILALLFIVGAVLLHSLVLTYLWAWFVVPFGIQPISVAWAIGITGILAFLKGPNYKQLKEKIPTSELFEHLGHVIVWPLLAWLAGYIVHFWM